MSLEALYKCDRCQAQEPAAGNLGKVYPAGWEHLRLGWGRERESALRPASAPADLVLDLCPPCVTVVRLAAASVVGILGPGRYDLPGTTLEVKP